MVTAEVSPGEVPRPRGAHAARPQPAAAAAAAAAAAPMASGLVRSALADVAAALVLLTVLPLALLQLPDAIAWAIPAKFAIAGPAAETSLLRASGLAIVAMAVATPIGGLAVRRFRPWPVLVTGLAVAAAADLLAGAGATVASVGINRCLHGAGAGLALAAATALAAQHPRGSGGRVPPSRGGAWGAGFWAVSAVLGLAAAPEVMRHRLAAGDWHAALRPYPWLTGVALGCAALYALLAKDPVPPGARGDFSAAERTQLTALAAPVAGMCAVTIAITFQEGKAVTAAAVTVAVSLAALVAATARKSWFASVCAAAGGTLPPAAGALGDLLHAPASRVVPGLPAGGLAQYAVVLAVAAICGAAIAVAAPARSGTVTIACGALAAGTGFILAGLPAQGTVLTGAHPGLLAVACALIAGGFTAALAAAWRRLAPPGLAAAIAGTVLLLAGSLAGYLADGAIQLHALDAAQRTHTPVHTALRIAAAQWYLIAAMIVGCLALWSALGACLSVFSGRPGQPLTSGFPANEVNEAAGAPITEAGGTAKSE